jgi:hypothetical protein
MKFEDLKEKVHSLQGREIKEENFHRHSNGGGWVENTACVEDSATVDEDAIIVEDAWVKDYAVIWGSAIIQGEAEISGHAEVSGTARVYGSTIVTDYASVYEQAQISGFLSICGATEICGDAWMKGYFMSLCGYGYVNGSVWEEQPIYLQILEHIITNSRHGWSTISTLKGKGTEDRKSARHEWWLGKEGKEYLCEHYGSTDTGISAVQDAVKFIVKHGK